jgi:hypothetical protein
MGIARPRVSGGAKGVGMLDAMKADVAKDPVDVALFGAVGIVLDAQQAANLVEEFHGGPPPRL